MTGSQVYWLLIPAAVVVTLLALVLIGALLSATGRFGSADTDDRTDHRGPPEGSRPAWWSPGHGSGGLRPARLRPGSGRRW
jgi:hypothetical protein